MLIRSAKIADAEQVASVLRRSIQELCVLDHDGEDDTLRQWLSNKTPKIVGSWIEAPDQCVMLAEEDGAILGVGGASHAGEITLNYVAPESRFKGVSKSILASLEAYLRDLGWAQSTLTSTRTAHSFYVAAGYKDAGESEFWGKLLGQPMKKSL
ncbi:GNAT family N-acetyltransferase [Phyllobacterium salinisoli]|uniref:GNAT family N-acetyltransferase n=1 Tax=Phyllobacterium salinisoli TaxID=1899321 RepID=A0A368JWH5_9HYPH|nr:GNAT family N-acetyltransferase [Phyllobacterium salinisoli]RCS21526.1 GNAT family N-acetyltransferase [Phyllobacterium salinisoli]